MCWNARLAAADGICGWACTARWAAWPPRPAAAWPRPSRTRERGTACPPGRRAAGRGWGRPRGLCRSCRLTTRGRWVPAGWYVLERAAGGGGRHLRVGLYCSLGCLAAAAGGGLAEAEQDAGARHGLPAGAARGRARLVEIAQTLL